MFLFPVSLLSAPAAAEAVFRGQDLSTILLPGVLAAGCCSGSSSRAVSGQALRSAPQRKSGPSFCGRQSPPPTPRGWRFLEVWPPLRRAAPDLWGVCSLLWCPLRPAAMISASRAVAARLMGASASRSLAAARHQVRKCHAFWKGLQALT